MPSENHTEYCKLVSSPNPKFPAGREPVAANDRQLCTYVIFHSPLLLRPFKILFSRTRTRGDVKKRRQERKLVIRRGQNKKN